MKRLVLSLVTLHLSLLTLSAAVPLRWTVETSGANPATFDQFAGATYDLEAALQSRGKPLAVSGEPRLYWQTNGMGSAWWSAPASASGNVLRATWTPSCDVGARAYSCFIGVTGSVYNAAFQLRLRPSPGATPNELPLPVPTIDFSKVTVLNPPWPTGRGVGTNDVVDIVRKTVAGSARYLPKYLWLYDCADSYPDDAAWYYAQPQPYGSCSAVRDGGFLFRNYDWKFDDAAEFVVSMAAGPGRYASIGVANCGTNLTEEIVTSGRPSRYYKCLPGRTVDGINENGVVCEVNVVDGPVTNGWHEGGDIHPFAAVRWALDNGTSAEMVATNLAARIQFPAGWRQNFHWMVADAAETWIVENGVASNVTGRAVMTNFPLLPTPTSGAGWERYEYLTNATANITNVWYTRSYLRTTNWVSEFKNSDETEAAKVAWETHAREQLRGHGLWQTVHTSVYDLTNRTLRIAVQETDDWYTFAVDRANVDLSPIEAQIASLASSVSGLESSKRDKDDLDVYSGTSVVDRIATTNGVQNAIETHHDDTKVSKSGTTTMEQGAVIEFQDGGISLGGGSLHGEHADAHFMFLEVGGVSFEDKADDADLEPVRTDAANALAFSRATYDYMTGNTNAWFSGTNYVVGADSTNRTHFAFEDGMDLERVPCSMALWEIRDGKRQCVWDQRDWPTWYWNFKAEQLSNGLARVTGDLSEEVRTNCMKRGWAKYTAVRGLDNPDPSTLWIDTPKVQLMAGHQWEKIVETGGAGYWTITGNGIELSQQDAESTFLTIKDFEGNACLTFRKTSSYLVYCECGTDITRNFYDAQGRVVFHLTTDVQPTAEFSTTLELDSFVEQDEDGCPASCEWTGSAGNWDCHFVLKPGITARACFVRFKVMREGENVVEHTFPIKINGGIAFEQDGVTRKIRPTISGNTVNWVVVQ